MKIIKSSIIKSKIKRSGIALKDTQIFEDNHIENKLAFNFLLNENEEVIIKFENDIDKWVLTNYRILFPNKLSQILLGEIIGVDIENIRSQESTKNNNTSIDLLLSNQKKVSMNVENGTWPLMFEVFKYIANYRR